MYDPSRLCAPQDVHRVAVSLAIVDDYRQRQFVCKLCLPFKLPFLYGAVDPFIVVLKADLADGNNLFAGGKGL